MDIVMHNWNKHQVRQRAVDGFVSLTDMCKAEGRVVGKYLELPSTKAYISALAEDLGKLSDNLVVSKEGRGGGTYAHPEIAIDCAQWISVPFRIWANRTLRLIIANQFAPQTADAAIAQSQLKQEYSHVLDRPDPWKKLFDQEFCKQIYALGGPGFYWEFCYHWLTPTERCEIELKNPVLNGRRHDRIHQFFSEETKLRLKPYLAELAAVVATANGDKKAFWTGYRKHFKGINQLDIPFPPLD